ncbi:PAS domain-containing protein [Acuticoccus sp. I52.16.1]|uniref:PAS domain-containing protein n=1 Tax=Acuticoccus sp. I52.16.1 TaxID=2928472 RepID=UPI001FD497F8|nr:PAS domain-containing protein [Acuticoccus sp. I52.16.1]UOM34122.1 PAS domain-containing protein [Acuticoccus sp. I52.16.1]
MKHQNEYAQIFELFELSPAGLALFDAQTPFRVHTHNPRYQTFWDEPFASDGMVGMPLQSFVTEARPAGILAAFERVVRTGQAESGVDFPYDGLARGRVWLNWHLAPVVQGGRVVSIAQTLIDVTREHEARAKLEREVERRQAIERELRDQEHKLLMEQSFFDSIIEVAPVGISIARDPMGKPPIINRTAREMTGLFQIPGGLERYDQGKAVHEDGRPYTFEDYPTAKALLHGVVTRNEEMRYRTADGDRRWLLNSSPLRDDEGKIIAAITAFVDIESQRQAEEHVRLMNRELNHRLKNLFSVLRGLVVVGAQQEKDARQAAAKLCARLDALAAAHLISIDSDRMEPIPVNRLLEAVLSPYEDALRSWELSGPDLLMARQAVTPIGLVIHELATNAIKYGAWSPSGGHVEVTWGRQDDSFCLEWREFIYAFEDRQPKTEPADGFGGRLIRSSVAQLGGRMARRWAPEGVLIRIQIPSENLVEA